MLDRTGSVRWRINRILEPECQSYLSGSRCVLLQRQSAPEGLCREQPTALRRVSPDTLVTARRCSLGTGEDSVAMRRRWPCRVSGDVCSGRYSGLCYSHRILPKPRMCRQLPADELGRKFDSVHGDYAWCRCRQFLYSCGHPPGCIASFRRRRSHADK